jgi:outer membrane protein TolC
VARAYRLAGLATAGDTAQAEAAWADARLQFLRARAAARSAEGSLAYDVGLSVNSVLALASDDSSDLEDLPALPALPGLAAQPIDDLLATARTSFADLLALSALLQQSEAQVVAAQAQGRPSLGLSAQAERRWSNDGGNAGSASTQGLALTLSIPLFDGGLVRVQVQAARARTQQLAPQRE